MPINAIMGIGRKMEQALQKMNVLTLGDYVALPDNLLDKKWGIVGVELKQKLLGNDTSEVASQISTPKSVGNGTTTIVDITTEEEFIATIGFLSEKIATRLREKSLLAGGVGVYVKTADFEHFSKERKLDYPTNSSSVIAQNAMKILKSFWNFDTPVRAVRVHTFALVDEQALTQASLFFDTKKQRLGYGLDQIWNKYGPDAIALASSVKSNFLNK